MLQLLLYCKHVTRFCYFGLFDSDSCPSFINKSYFSSLYAEINVLMIIKGNNKIILLILNIKIYALFINVL